MVADRDSGTKPGRAATSMMMVSRAPRSTWSWPLRTSACAIAASLTACYSGLSSHTQPLGTSGADDGSEDDSSSSPADMPSDAEPASFDRVWTSGVRRLTAREYTDTVRDLLLDDEFDGTALLPIDVPTPFDNEYGIQVASQGLIEGADLLAARAAERLLEDAARLDEVVGCAPLGPDDAACMRAFIASFGRRALRRPLSDDEIDLRLHGAAGDDGALDHAIEAGDFAIGVESIVRALLQDPEFLYRVEIGTPVPGEPGLFALSPFEIATRLSYLVWGSAPDDLLLDRAAQGELGDGDAIRAAAEDMLADPRAVGRIARFHAMWLGYASLPHPAEISAAMQAETTALVERVLFDDDLPWQDLFRFPETYVSDLLAENYGLPLPGSSEPAWVDYGDTGRLGLLSHGSFLSIGAVGNDTSPVTRGRFVSERLFCNEVPDPPPGVGDDPPTPPNTVCKVDRYAVHSSGGCAGCHVFMDPVGFGLENYDPLGRYREYEPDDPVTEADESQCEITGEGEVAGIGTFHGPSELAQLALDSASLSQCVVTQLVRFTAGHAGLDDHGAQLVGALLERIGSGDFHFDDLVLELVADDAFRHRREDGGKA